MIDEFKHFHVLVPFFLSFWPLECEKSSYICKSELFTGETWDETMKSQSHWSFQTEIFRTSARTGVTQHCQQHGTKSLDEPVMKVIRPSRMDLLQMKLCVGNNSGLKARVCRSLFYFHVKYLCNWCHGPCRWPVNCPWLIRGHLSAAAARKAQTKSQWCP